MTSTENLRLDTTQLQVGDVVLEHGMRIRIFDEAEIYHSSHSVLGVYVWPGVVINLTDVMAGDNWLLKSFMYESRWNDKRGQWVRVLTGNWDIQGNKLATWNVERETN